MVKRRLNGNGPVDRLSDDERKRLREVMGKVWNSDKVKSARDAATEAAKQYRDALHLAAMEADPSIKPLLEKIIEKMGNLPPMTPFGPGDNNGPEEARGEGGGPGRLFGVDPEGMGKLTDEQRGQLRQAFERISSMPLLNEARAAVESANGEGKREAVRKMRRVVREALEKEFPELAKRLNEMRPKRGPGGEEEAPPPPPGPGDQAPPPPNAPGAPENAPPK